MKGYNKLKGFMTERNITQQELSELLGINRHTLNNKINLRNADFTLSEVRTICKKYRLDANEFFLI